MTRFDDLTRAQAEAVLEGHVAGLPASLARLSDRTARSGGPLWALDASVDQALPAVWGWFLAQQHALDVAWEGADLPWWAEFDQGFCARFSPQLLWDVDGLAAVLCRHVLEAVPDATWAVGEGQDYVWHNQPVLRVRGGDVNPLHVVQTAVHKVVIGGQLGARDQLLRRYERWVGRPR